MSLLSDPNDIISIAICPVTSHYWYLIQCWLVFNSLGPSDAIWLQRSRSTLAQVMACCLTAPSHYLNQCWLTSELLVPMLSGFENKQPKFSIQGNAFQNIVCKMLAISFWLNNLRPNLPGAKELITTAYIQTLTTDTLCETCIIMTGFPLAIRTIAKRELAWTFAKMEWLIFAGLANVRCPCNNIRILEY